jgi:hypothetical protein
MPRIFDLLAVMDLCVQTLLQPWGVELLPISMGQMDLCLQSGSRWLVLPIPVTWL